MNSTYQYEPLYYNNARRAVYQVEAFMLSAALLLFFQLVCGSLRRRTNNSFIQGGLWLGYTLLPPLTTYTLGLMQSSAVKVVMYPVWALSLFLVAGGANSITAYDLDDNKQWKRRLFDILQYDIYFCIILLRLLYPSTEDSNGHETAKPFMSRLRNVLSYRLTFPVSILLVIVFIGPMFRVLACWMVSYSHPSKVIADYMKDQATKSRPASSTQESLDRVSIEGCKYMVSWPGYKVTRIWSGASSIYRCVTPQEGVVTVEMVWRKCNEEDAFTSQGVSSSRIKGACLSYSLSHLLKRRFFGMDCAEANLEETRQFILKGLLSENNTDEYTEAFRVIEVELAFLYDFFYTKYAVIFGTEKLFFLLTIVKIICSFALGVLLVYIQLFTSINSRDGDLIIIITPKLSAVIISAAIIVAFLVVEVWQSILYLGSDWAMVSLACCYVTGSSHGFIPLAFRKSFGFFISRKRRPTFGYWQNRLGQCSVIEDSKFYGSRNDFAFQSNSLTMFTFSKVFAYLGRSLRNLFSCNSLDSVKLPDMMKPMIVASLKSNTGGHLSNGEASLLKHNLASHPFSLTLQNETHTENMLVWHIATDYCANTFDKTVERYSEEQQKQILGNFQVATRLSRYCAYLMSNVPEFLPGSSVDTKFAFDQAMYEAREAFGSKMRDRGVIAQSRRDSMTGSILSKGLKLGAELESMPDVSRRWQVMADFWVETILYVAPSDNAVAHMDRLAQGGEFLTHLWALLTHAGILTRSQGPTA